MQTWVEAASYRFVVFEWVLMQNGPEHHWTRALNICPRCTLTFSKPTWKQGQRWKRVQLNKHSPEPSADNATHLSAKWERGAASALFKRLMAAADWYSWDLKPQGVCCHCAHTHTHTGGCQSTASVRRMWEWRRATLANILQNEFCKLPYSLLNAALEQHLGRNAERNSLFSYPNRTPAKMETRQGTKRRKGTRARIWWHHTFARTHTFKTRTVSIKKS